MILITSVAGCCLVRYLIANHYHWLSQTKDYVHLAACVCEANGPDTTPLVTTMGTAPSITTYKDTQTFTVNWLWTGETFSQNSFCRQLRNMTIVHVAILCIWSLTYRSKKVAISTCSPVVSLHPQMAFGHLHLSPLVAATTVLKQKTLFNSPYLWWTCWPPFGTWPYLMACFCYNSFDHCIPRVSRRSITAWRVGIMECNWTGIILDRVLGSCR